MIAFLLNGSHSCQDDHHPTAPPTPTPTPRPEQIAKIERIELVTSQTTLVGKDASTKIEVIAYNKDGEKIDRNPRISWSFSNENHNDTAIEPERSIAGFNEKVNLDDKFEADVPQYSNKFCKEFSTFFSNACQLTVTALTSSNHSITITGTHASLSDSITISSQAPNSFSVTNIELKTEPVYQREGWFDQNLEYEAGFDPPGSAPVTRASRYAFEWAFSPEITVYSESQMLKGDDFILDKNKNIIQVKDLTYTWNFNSPCRQLMKIFPPGTKPNVLFDGNVLRCDTNFGTSNFSVKAVELDNISSQFEIIAPVSSQTLNGQVDFEGVNP